MKLVASLLVALAVLLAPSSCRDDAPRRLAPAVLEFDDHGRAVGYK